jgi:hypothetical protein
MQSNSFIGASLVLQHHRFNLHFCEKGQGKWLLLQFVIASAAKQSHKLEPMRSGLSRRFGPLGPVGLAMMAVFGLE